MSQSQKLAKQFEKASGRTQHILALIFDIRGFTAFCRSEDSFNIANFVRRVYVSVLSDYFQDATFYKPTGDGLLIVFNCSARAIELLEKLIWILPDSTKIPQSGHDQQLLDCLLYTSPSPRDRQRSRMPSSA